MRGLHHFKIRGKLAPRLIGPFRILGKRGEVAYQLDLSPQLSDVHDVFHDSQLKRCLCVPEEQIPREELDAKEDNSLGPSEGTGICMLPSTSSQSGRKQPLLSKSTSNLQSSLSS
jgi:hypothetical protein